MNKSMFMAILQPTRVGFILDSVGSACTLTVFPAMNALGIHLKLEIFGERLF